MTKKVGHWDSAVREITASALHNLALVAPEPFLKSVLSSLVSSAESASADLFLRHGAIMSSGFVVSALAEVARRQGRDDLSDFLGAETVSSVSQIGVSLVQRLSLKVSGGDLLRQAIAAHIEQCARAAFPVHETEIVGLWQAILGKSLFV